MSGGFYGYVHADFPSDLEMMRYELAKQGVAVMGALHPGILVTATEEQVVQHTRDNIDQLRLPGIGLDGAGVTVGCEMPANAPSENIMACANTIREYAHN